MSCGGGASVVPSSSGSDSTNTAPETVSISDRGSPDLDELGRVYMKSLVSGRYDFLRDNAFATSSDLQLVSAHLEASPAELDTRLEEQFLNTRKDGDSAGIAWSKTKVLTTNFLKETLDNYEYATLDILVSAEGHEYVFKARCVRINLVWYIIGGLELDDSSQGT